MDLFMYFLLAIAFAVIGIGILLWNAKPRYSEHPRSVIDTDRWIDKAEFFMQKTIKQILHTFVVHLVSWYRIISHEITIHKTLKQKVREILYEHHKQKKSAVGKDHLVK
jgi:uncharacterized membrane protein